MRPEAEMKERAQGHTVCEDQDSNPGVRMTSFFSHTPCLGVRTNLRGLFHGVKDYFRKQMLGIKGMIFSFLRKPGPPAQYSYPEPQFSTWVR